MKENMKEDYNPLNPATWLPKEVWLTQKPDNYEEPVKIYTGNYDNIHPRGIMR